MAATRTRSSPTTAPNDIDSQFSTVGDRAQNSSNRSASPVSVAQHNRVVAAGVTAEGDTAGIDPDSPVAVFVAELVGVVVEDIVVAATLDERVDERCTGAVIHRELAPVERQFAHLTEVRAELVDRLLERLLAVVVAADGVEVEVTVERRRRERCDDVGVNHRVTPLALEDVTASSTASWSSCVFETMPTCMTDGSTHRSSKVSSSSLPRRARPTAGPLPTPSPAPSALRLPLQPPRN